MKLIHTIENTLSIYELNIKKCYVFNNSKFYILKIKIC